MKNLFSLLVKFLLSLLFTLALIEGGLRLFPQVIPLDLLIHFNDHPKREVAGRVGLKTRGETVRLVRDDHGPELNLFKPYTTVVWPIEENGTVSVVTMDENGFCNPPGEGHAKTAHADIITIGDSFTWCQSVQPEETWASRIPALTGLSVYNLGVSGIGPYEYIQVLKKFGLQKSPQVVIMNIYEGNDLRDVADYAYYRLYHKDAEPAAESPDSAETLPPLSVRTFLETYSYTVNLITAAGDYWQEEAAPDSPAAAADKIGESRRTENFGYSVVFPGQTVSYNPANTDTDEMHYARQLYSQTLTFEVLASIRQPLKEFVELSRQYGFVPIVTYSPSAHTAYAANVVFEDPELSTVMPWVSQQQRDFLAQQAQELGYLFVDFTPALQAAAQTNGPDTLLYYRYDLHFTPAGHKLVAETISPILLTLNTGQ